MDPLRPSPASAQHSRGASPPGHGPPGPAARERHSLLSLVELSRKLWSAHDVYEVAESLLLNLMGQTGTAQAALWLGTTGSGEPVLIRCHGIDRVLARSLGHACWADLVERERRPGEAVVPSDVRIGMGQTAERLAKEANVALFAPLCVDDVPNGMVAIGGKLTHAMYTPVEVQVLQSSLAIAGMAVRSAHLHGITIETSRKLRRANLELEELDRMKSEFIDHVNHELRTPLTVVQGSLECLSREGISVERNEALLGAANHATDQMMRLVHRLVTLSESVTHDLRLKMQFTDVAGLLAAYHAARRPGVASGLRELHLEGLTCRRLAEVDETRLTQVLDELVDNAVKFSASGANIWLRLSEWVEDGREWVRISVEDDGFGIPRDSLPLLFQSFRQLNGSMTRDAGGLGIGLAAAKQVIEAMGGRISASSEEGRGSTFSLLLAAE